MKRPKVAHIVPAMNIGGVEVGIEKSMAELRTSWDYKVYWVKKPGKMKIDKESVLKLFRSCILGDWIPDVVVTSLWYSHPVGALLQLFGCKWVAFFHNSGFSHTIDRMVQKWAWRAQNFALVDSGATLKVMSKFKSRSADVVPFIFPQTSGTGVELRSIDMLWVGRAVPAKRMDLFIKLIDCYLEYRPNAKCVMVIAGEIPACVLEAAQRHASALQIHNNLDNAEVRELMKKAKYYVLTSDYEGMSMTTVEAIQNGCVPVVRLVGELGSYIDHENGVIISGIQDGPIEQTARFLCKLDELPSTRSIMVQKGLNRIAQIGGYVDSFNKSISRIMKY